MTAEPSKRAQEIIRMADREEAKQSNFRNLWQQVADLMYPYEDQIIARTTPGEDLSAKRYDDTAAQDGADMASGLSQLLIPNGQKFFSLTLANKALLSNPRVVRHLADATEIAHEEIIGNSNFMQQFNESLRSLVTFGTNYLFSEWAARKLRLNYKDFPIWKGYIKEDAWGNVDTMIMRYAMSARQALQQFGESTLSGDIIKAAADPDHESDKFKFIHYVAPRVGKDGESAVGRNKPWESTYVDVKNKLVIEEGGYEEFPFAVGRWMKRVGEKYGRGQGTECLATVRVLNQIVADMLDLANKHVNPALEVVRNAIEGKIRVTPGAINYVERVGSIKAMDPSAVGNYPVGENEYKRWEEKVHRAFYADVFKQLASLTGDRRTTVEIAARLREGLRRMAQPSARLYREMMDPCLKRSVLLLYRNGRIPPSPELAGQPFSMLGVEYVGQLALALRDQQAEAFTEFAQVAVELEGAFPGATDYINLDTAMPDFAIMRGVKVDHLATPEQVAAKRKARADQQQAAMQMQAAEAVGKAYKSGAKAPEEGSASGKLMEAMGVK